MTNDIHKLRQLYIFDTTLRDGEQAPGYSLTIDQKIRLAEELQSLGVNTIETGFPMSSPTDFDATREISKLLKRAQPCGFARALKCDVEACAKAMADAINPVIEIASVGSDIHLIYKRNVSREQTIAEAIDAIKCAKAFGFKDISLALEDATRGDMEFMKKLIGEGLDQGITAIVIPDTIGCCLPEEFYALIKQLRDFVGSGIRISIHCHNDMGLAIANCVAGIMAGADEVQTTLCGIGERAGNASLEELVAILNTKQHILHRVHNIIHHKLYSVCNLLIDMLNLKVPPHKPILGANAFSTEAGMHQQGVMKHRFTYEWLRAEDYGATPRTVIGRHSGRNFIRQLLLEGGIRDIDHTVVDLIHEHIIKEANAEHYNQLQLLVDKYNELKKTTEELTVAV